MAWTSVVLEPGICLTGLERYPIVQDQGDWVDTGSYRTGILEASAGGLTGCQLVVEGCDSLDGVWTSIAELDGRGSGQAFLRRSAPQGSSERLPQYIRWRLHFEASSAWSAVFRIFLTLKD